MGRCGRRSGRDSEKAIQPAQILETRADAGERKIPCVIDADGLNLLSGPE